MITFNQAVRNAIEIERAAAAFYRKLESRARDEQTRAFFLKMARIEDQHAQTITEIGEQIAAGMLPAQGDGLIQAVETSPQWAMAEEIDYHQALDLAIEAENSAALYYDAMADFAQGDVAKLFKDLTQTELQHAKMLRELKQRQPSP